MSPMEQNIVNTGTRLLTFVRIRNLVSAKWRGVSMSKRSIDSLYFVNLTPQLYSIVTEFAVTSMPPITKSKKILCPHLYSRQVAVIYSSVLT